MKKKPIVVGFDFDGVVAYNPLRVARMPVSYVKRVLTGKSHVRFFVPKTDLQRKLWALAHETSMFPAKGVSLLRTLVQSNAIEAHLVTGRFGYLEPGLQKFLQRWNLLGSFKSITVNTKNEQPHIYKLRMIEAKKFDYYIEDNWDIVDHFWKQKSKTKVYWVYNILDNIREYPFKVPYVEKALRDIMHEHSL